MFFFCSLVMMDQQFVLFFSCFFFFKHICAYSRKYCRFHPHFSFLSSLNEQMGMLMKILASAFGNVQLVEKVHFSCYLMDSVEEGGKEGHLG